MSLKELPQPSIASLRAIAALRSPHLAGVRPARIGLGFESAGANQKSLAEVEDHLGGPGRLSLPYSLRWLLDVLTGVGVLHRTLSFVHGEVQPEHIVLGEDGVGRLVPVVRAHWVRGEERTPERLYYLAPEKLLGDKVDIRSDLYSVGVMLWEALAGQRMIEATEVDDIIARLMGGGMPRAHAPEREAWTEPLTGIAERAISIDPTRRFATVAEMKEALETACSRYLASAPGMAELFQNPERRARTHVRESIPPDSQRVTLPPEKKPAPANAPSESQRLDAAAERLAQASLSAIEVEDELTTKPNAVPLPVARKGKHVGTLIGVPPPFIDRPEARAEEIASRPPPSEAKTVMVPVEALKLAAEPAQAMNLTVPVGTPAPVIAARPPPAAFEPGSPPSSVGAGRRPASLAPFVSPDVVQPAAVEPSFELVRPRKRRGAMWLILGAAAAVGLFAARPWLARQVAAATGALPDNAAPMNEAPPNAAVTPTPNANADANPSSNDSAAAEPSGAPTAVGIASTPPVPSERPVAGRHGGAGQEHVVIHDRVEPAPLSPSPTPAPEPKPEKKPEPVAAPPPPATPPPAPKSKPVPVSDADRYGI